QSTIGGSSDVKYEKAPKYMSRDRTTAVTFRSEAIVVETTKYYGYERLRRVIALVLRARHDLEPIDGVERVGLRYVNEIRVPEVGSQPGAWEPWIDDSLLGPVPIGERLGLTAMQMQ